MPVTLRPTPAPAPDSYPAPDPAPDPPARRVISRSVRQRNKLVKHLKKHYGVATAAAELKCLRNKEPNPTLAQPPPKRSQM